jgi:hypothetical protein
MYITELIKNDKRRTSRKNICYGEAQYKLYELPKQQVNVTLGDLEGNWKVEVRCVVL